MELGEKIRSARLEKGLSQRQLCGDRITRNMLSQIENGSARPSMTTLQLLAERLGKPVAYFLNEETPSPNVSVVQRARAAAPEEALIILKEYIEDDPALDPERWLIQAHCCLLLAKAALAKKQPIYALELLSMAEDAGSRTPYYTEDLRRQILIARYQAQPEKAAALAQSLPDITQELLLRGEAALQKGDYDACIRLLQAVIPETPRSLFFLGKAYLKAGDPAAAIPCFTRAEGVFGSAVYPLLEQCYRETEDFQKAYEYACKQR